MTQTLTEKFKAKIKGRVYRMWDPTTREMREMSDEEVLAHNQAYVKSMAIDIKRLKDAGATEGERSAAAAALNRLLLKHNLTMDDITALGDEEETRVKSGFITIQPYADWKEALLVIIAEASLCRVLRYGPVPPKAREPYSRYELDWYWKDEPVKFVMFGHAHNLVVARALADWLLPAVWTEATNAASMEWGRDSEDSIGDGLWHGWRHSFAVGAVAGLEKAFQGARDAERKDNTEQQWGIIPVLEEEVDRRVAKFGEAGSLGDIEANYDSAFRAGRTYGRAINVFGAQLGAGKQAA